MRTEVLQLVEYEERFASDDLVSVVDAHFWKDIGVTIGRFPNDNYWRLRAGSLSGIARAKNRSLDLTVHIRPKLSGADTIFLAEYAYGQRINALHRPASDRIAIDSLYADPVAALLVWYTDSVAHFATRWLRRNYRTKQVTLHGHVRGRFLVSRYVSQNLSTARNAEVPCVVTERTIDTANNRILKAGLRRVAKLARTLPTQAARQSVRSSVNAVLPQFSEVTDVKVGPLELRATRTSGPERHYAQIMQTTLDLLNGRYLGQSLGLSPVDSFLWSMPELFQEALRGILVESGVFSVESAKRPSAHIHDGAGRRLRSSRIDPDYVLRGPKGTLLLDAKYKEALRVAEPGDDSISVGTNGLHLRVARQDIYQMVAYRQQPSWAGAAVALAYPLVVAEGDSLPEPYEVRGLGQPVQLVFVDVGTAARKNLPAFIETLQRL